MGGGGLILVGGVGVDGGKGGGLGVDGGEGGPDSGGGVVGLKFWKYRVWSIGGVVKKTYVHAHESFAIYTLSALSRNSTMLCFCPRTSLIGGGGGGGGAGAGGTRGGEDWSCAFGMA